MSALYRTAHHVDMKTTAWYEQKRPRTGTRRSHSPTDRTGAFGRRGFGAENTIYTRTTVYFRAFSVRRLPMIFSGRTMNLIFLFDVRSFTSLIQNCKFRKALDIVEIQRNAPCKARPPSLHQVPILTPEYLLPLQWVPILAPTHSLPLRFEFLFTDTKSGTGTYPIGDDSLSRSTRRSFAPLQKPPRNQNFMCEQKPYRIWFSCRPKSYLL